MFDIGFWELTIIGIVALIVIGPERLPGVARTAGLWIGKMKRVVGDMKMEIDKELKAEELKKILQQQADSAGIHEIIEEGKGTLEDINSDLNVTEKTIQGEFDDMIDPDVLLSESHPDGEPESQNSKGDITEKSGDRAG